MIFCYLATARFVLFEVKSSTYKCHASFDEFCKKFSSRILHKYLVYTKVFNRKIMNKSLMSFFEIATFLLIHLNMEFFIRRLIAGCLSVLNFKGPNIDSFNSYCFFSSFQLKKNHNRQYSIIIKR